MSADSSMASDLGNYIQFPRLVLLGETQQTRSVECAICQSTCHYNPEKTDDDSSSMAILPCGHVFCKTCVVQALEIKPACPICRMSLKYRMCPHPLKPRVLYDESVLMLPETVRSADKLPPSCPDCRRKAAVRQAFWLFNMYRPEIEEANQAFERARTDGNRDSLSAADVKAHRILLSSFIVRAQFDW